MARALITARANSLPLLLTIRALRSAQGDVLYRMTQALLELSSRQQNAHRQSRWAQEA